MVIVIADKTGKALRELADYELEVAFGDDENTITLTTDADVMAPQYGYVYIDGTEYGGTIDQIKSGTSTNTLSGTGRSFHGILAGKRIVPSSGQSHVVVSGQVSTVLQQIIELLDLDDLFEAPATESDAVAISSYQFERFVDAYTGLKAMCLANSLKLTMRCVSGKVLLGAKAVVDYGSKVDSDLLDFELTVISRCTNHLICGGTGENENRAIVHFYADSEGNVSHTQTLFGIDEIEGFYDYSNADEDQLEEDGKKKLEEMQTTGEVKVSVHEDLDINVGDIVTGRDNKTGMVVSAPITKKIVKVSKGVAAFSYEAGTASQGTSASTISGSAESSGGGHAYYEGYGISIDNYTINAEVAQEDLNEVDTKVDNAVRQASDASSTAGSALSAAATAQQTADGKADAVHTHNASDVVNGTLAISRGGTNAETATEAVYNLLANANSPEIDITGINKFNLVLINPNMSTTSSPLGYVTSDAVWSRFYDAIKAAVKPSDIGAASSSHTHNYAGSSSAGGVANSAKKLDTPRTITLTGAVNGSASFDGSQDIVITTTGDSEAASFLAAHPVGCIYESSSSDNPNTVYGGTWKALPSVAGFIWERTA